MLCYPLAGADNEQMSNLNFASLRLPTCHALRRRTQAGFSLMEVMVVAVIVAIMAVLAVPSFSGMVQRQRVKNAADAVLSDLRWARSEAIKRGQDVTVTITPGTTNWQYAIYESGSPNSIKSVSGSEFFGVPLDSNTSNIKFDAVRGTVAGNGTVVVGIDQNKKYIKISALGRIRVCNNENCE